MGAMAGELRPPLPLSPAPLILTLSQRLKETNVAPVVTPAAMTLSFGTKSVWISCTGCEEQ